MRSFLCNFKKIGGNFFSIFENTFFPYFPILKNRKKICSDFLKIFTSCQHRCKDLTTIFSASGMPCAENASGFSIEVFLLLAIFLTVLAKKIRFVGDFSVSTIAAQECRNYLPRRTMPLSSSISSRTMENLRSTMCLGTMSNRCTCQMMVMPE